MSSPTISTPRSTRPARQLAAHLAECDECRAYLATYRRTAGAAGAAARLPMPPELRRRLTAFLLERLRGAAR